MTEQKALIIETEQVLGMVAQDAIDNKAEPYALGHGFLWGYYLIKGKRHKVLLGSGCASNWSEIQDYLERELRRYNLRTWVNLD